MPISVMNPQKSSNSIDITSIRDKKPFAGAGKWLAFNDCNFFVSVHFIIDFLYDPMIRKTEIVVIVHGNYQMLMHLNAHNLGSLNNYRCDF